MCTQCSSPLSTAPFASLNSGRKDRLVAGLFALFLGWLGIHKFYLGSYGWGIVYVCLSCTGIPFILGIVEGIQFFTMDEPRFAMRYQQTPSSAFKW